LDVLPPLRADRLVRTALAALAAIALLAFGPNAAHASRVALVVGIDAYDEIPDLDNAVSDACGMAAALQAKGFRVTLLTDPDRRAMVRGLEEFAAGSLGAEAALFYFAGHAVELDGTNVLLPADFPADVRARDRALAEGIELLSVAEQLARAEVRHRVMIVDACRDNPLPRAGGRSLGAPRGLARIAPPNGLYIVFSAGTGETALDRVPGTSSPHGLFTHHLLQAMREARPGAEFDDVVRAARMRVFADARRVNHAQSPAIYDQAISPFVLVPAAAPPPAPAAPAPAATGPAAAGDAAMELVFWQSAQRIDTSDGYLAYLARYPDGHFADLARVAISRLEEAAARLVAQAPVRPSPTGPSTSAASGGPPPPVQASPAAGAPPPSGQAAPHVSAASPGRPQSVAALPATIGGTRNWLAALGLLRRDATDDDSVRQALAEFQRRQGLPATGVEDADTLRRLALLGGQAESQGLLGAAQGAPPTQTAAAVVPPAPPDPQDAARREETALGLDRAAMRQVQIWLGALGHDPGGTDGLAGPRTRAAIRGYQRAERLPVTGFLTDELLTRMERAGEAAVRAALASRPPAAAASPPPPSANSVMIRPTTIGRQLPFTHRRTMHDTRGGANTSQAVYTLRGSISQTSNADRSVTVRLTLQEVTVASGTMPLSFALDLFVRPDGMIARVERVGRGNAGRPELAALEGEVLRMLEARPDYLPGLWYRELRIGDVVRRMDAAELERRLAATLSASPVPQAPAVNGAVETRVAAIGMSAGRSTVSMRSTGDLRLTIGGERLPLRVSGTLVLDVASGVQVLKRDVLRLEAPDGAVIITEEITVDLSQLDR
jgi:uncharacterized caspase-like protein/peptidoglycan hydrolase-like protein with peptidoglycan-binding domain